MSTPFDHEQTIPEGEHPLLSGRYRVVRRLGAGGMGEVHLVEDLKLDGRQFAVKLLPAFLAANKRAIAGLKREALHAMELSHSHIVTVRGFEEMDSGQPFLVMDYVDGQTLEELLLERERMSEAEVLRIFGPIAEALDYAHSRICHIPNTQRNRPEIMLRYGRHPPRPASPDSPTYLNHSEPRIGH